MPLLDGPRLAPASGGAARKLVVLLHGYGAYGDDLVPLAEAFADSLPDVAFLSPHAPFPCGGAPFGREWFPLSFRDPSEFSRGADAARPMLESFLAAELESLGLGPGDLALVGFSQGAMMALHTGLRRPAAPAVIIGYSGLLPAAERLDMEMVRPPPQVVLIHGEDDEVVPAPYSQIAAEALSLAGARVDSHMRPGLGHGVDAEGAAIGLASLAHAFARGR